MARGGEDSIMKQQHSIPLNDIDNPRLARGHQRDADIGAASALAFPGAGPADAGALHHPLAPVVATVHEFEDDSARAETSEESLAVRAPSEAALLRRVPKSTSARRRGMVR